MLGGIDIFHCTYCDSELICHNSLDTEDISYEISPETYIVNYWVCSNCDLDFIEEVSIDDKTLYFGPII